MLDSICLCLIHGTLRINGLYHNGVAAYTQIHRCVLKFCQMDTISTEILFQHTPTGCRPLVTFFITLLYFVTEILCLEIL